MAVRQAGASAVLNVLAPCVLYVTGQVTVAVNFGPAGADRESDGPRIRSLTPEANFPNVPVWSCEIEMLNKSVTMNNARQEEGRIALNDGVFWPLGWQKASC